MVVMINTTRQRVSFISALHDKYVKQEIIDDQTKVPKDSSISTEITFVGFNKVSNVQRELRRLTSIDLSGCDIHEAGRIQSIKDYLNKISVLNLSNNHLTWQEVINILPCLPNLRELILSNNGFQEDEDIIYPMQLYPGLRLLVLGQSRLGWPVVIERLSKIWSAVDHLDLWNDCMEDGMLMLDTLDLSSRHLVTNIRSLSLAKNQLTSLSWISKAGLSANLLELDVSRCLLETLNIDIKMVSLLKNLERLNISHNNINDWFEISQLNHLRNLKNLICNDNPFFESHVHARAKTVAQIANLVTLNRTTVTSAYRRDSEILYLREIHKNNEPKERHPRYDDLVEMYGLPEGASVKQRSVADKFVTIDLSYDDQKITKKVPRDMRVSNLKMLCKGLFKLRSSQIVCIASPPDESISYPLDQDGQTLHFFSVENNYRLIIKKTE